MIEKHKDMGRILGYPQKHIDYFCYGRLQNKISKIRQESLNLNPEINTNDNSSKFITKK